MTGRLLKKSVPIAVLDSGHGSWSGHHHSTEPNKDILQMSPELHAYVVS